VRSGEDLRLREEAGVAVPFPHGRLGMCSCQTVPFLSQMDVDNELAKSAWSRGS